MFFGGYWQSFDGVFSVIFYLLFFIPPRTYIAYLIRGIVPGFAERTLENTAWHAILLSVYRKGENCRIISFAYDVEYFKCFPC